MNSCSLNPVSPSYIVPHSDQYLSRIVKARFNFSLSHRMNLFCYCDKYGFLTERFSLSGLSCITFYKACGWTY